MTVFWRPRPQIQTILFSIVAVFVFLVIRPVLAEGEGLLLVKKEALDNGGLFFITDTPGLYVPAPTLKTKVEMSVTGMVTRVKVTQSFTNITEQWVEGIYTFPLPEKSAVDRLTMLIGERRVTGVIQEKEEARRNYEQARAEGRRVSLVSQERPNIFTNEVANIGPGETIVVEIEYKDQARFQDGTFEIRFPMVIRPRYIPGNKLPVTPEGSGWSFDTDQVPDASRITPPVLHPAYGKINPVEIEVDLKPGFPVDDVSSPSHEVVIKSKRGSYAIKLEEGEVSADSDFIVQWTPKLGATPASGLFSEKLGDDYYHLLMVVPRGQVDDNKVLPREVIFIIDVSGSMAGEAIRQAQAALLKGLDGLKPTDTFNIITFNSTPYDVYKKAIPATPDNIARAKNFVSRLIAEGGTEMAGALNIALNGGVRLERLRQVIFMTDGAVGNEELLLSMINRNLGDSRLFTVGIGSSPNSYFMREAAGMGKGTFTYIGDLNEVDEKMTTLFRKLEGAVLKDLTLSLPDGLSAEMFPSNLPDIYAGEPVVVAFRTERKVKGTIELSGTTPTSTWRQEVKPGKAESDSGVAALWAREKIGDITNEAIKAEQPSAPSVRKAIVDVALAFQLVSKFTSLIAIDSEIARQGEELKTTPIPTNLPKGMDPKIAIGRAVQDGYAFTIGEEDAVIISPQQAASASPMAQPAPPPPPPAAVNQLSPPQGSNGLWLKIFLGLLLLTLGLVFMWAVKRPLPIGRP